MTEQPISSMLGNAHAQLKVVSEIRKVTPYTIKGECGRCGKIAGLELYATALSNNFTDWVTVNPNCQGLCEDCAWAYNTRMLRIKPVAFTAYKVFFPTSEEIVEMLSKPILTNFALSFPVVGKKHVLPSVEWGTISSDDGPLRWGSEEVKVFEWILDFREKGCSEKDFESVTPPISLVLEATSNGTIDELLSHWNSFKHWRSSPYWGILMKASRNAKES